MKRNNPFNLSPKLLVSITWYTLVLGAVGMLIYSLPKIYHLLSATLIAFLLSYLLHPAVQVLERYSLNRGTATMVVFLFIFLLLGWMIVEITPFVWGQFQDFQTFLAEHDLTKVLAKYLGKVEDLIVFLDDGALTNQVGQAEEWLLNLVSSSRIKGILQNIYVVLNYVILIPFIAFFFTRDRRKIRHLAVQSAPNAFFEMAFNIYYKIDEKLGSYIRGILIESLIIGILSIIGLWIVDVPYLIVIGLFAGVANIVPYFGPVAGAIPAVIIKFFQTNEPMAVVPVLVVFLLVQIVDNVFVKPVIVARTMELHPLIVLLVVVAGGQIYGIMGMVMSIPIASMFLVVLSEISWGIKNYSFD
ncbi:MAG: AI-2E family transporter [bacterium]